MKKKDIIEELGSNQINEMMHIDQYWSIIGKSSKNSRDQDEQEKFLIRELSGLRSFPDVSEKYFFTFFIAGFFIVIIF